MFRRENRVRDTVLLTGWLFADLMLALFVIFLAANTSGIKPIPLTPTPSPTIPPTPTIARLNTGSYLLCLTINDYSTLPNDPGKTEVINQVRADPFLNRPGRRAALVIPYGGAPDINQEQTGLKIATNVVTVLQEQFSENSASVFYKTAFHGAVHDIGSNFGFIELEIYLFSQPDFTQPPKGNCPS